MCSAGLGGGVYLKWSLLLLTWCFITHSVVQTAQILRVSPSTVDPLPCYSDHDCPDTSYCFRIGQVCTDCFNCTSQFRSTRVKCARYVQDCGDCLPGYAEQTYSRFSSADRRWCKEIITVVAEPRKMDDTVILSMNFKWLALFMVGCISLLGFASYYCYNSSNRRDASISDSVSMGRIITCRDYTTTHSPPPTYNEHRFNDDNVSCSFQFKITENSVNDKQKAVPFPYIFENTVSGESTDNGPNGAQSSAENHGSSAANSAFSVPNLNIHDESTTPSFWTPGASYGDVPAESPIKDDEKISSPPKKRKKLDQ